jgi:hypothetical protein
MVLPMITPILQSSFLCAQDIKVPVESFKTAITAIATSCFNKFLLGSSVLSVTKIDVKISYLWGQKT